MKAEGTVMDVLALSPVSSIRISGTKLSGFHIIKIHVALFPSLDFSSFFSFLPFPS